MLEFIFNLSTTLTLFFLVMFVMATIKEHFRLMRKFSAWFIVMGIITLILGIIQYL